MGLFTWSGLISVLIGFLGISVMILVHELGHMMAARAAGINVEVLSFGLALLYIDSTEKRLNMSSAQYRSADLVR